ncbi:MAG TPA: RidA family protein [Gemmatimonadaceae bacterium]|nr:RidA family protein [Gemmatimonadaceae bacterium]
MPTSTIQRINPPTLPTPPGYSQIAVASGGSLIVIAGQVALDKQGQVVGLGDFASQATQVFRNLIAALDAAGANPRHLVKLTTFVTDLSHLPAFRQVRDQFLDAEHPPASTLLQVSRLFRPEFLLEVEAMAYR